MTTLTTPDSCSLIGWHWQVCVSPPHVHHLILTRVLLGQRFYISSLKAACGLITETDITLQCWAFSNKSAGERWCCDDALSWLDFEKIEKIYESNKILFWWALQWWKSESIISLIMLLNIQINKNNSSVRTWYQRNTCKHWWWGKCF